MFGTLALPLALAILLHVLSPRGSRESFSARLGHSGQGSLLLLLSILMLLGVFLMGLVAGAWYCLPMALGLLTVGLPAVMRPPVRWPALALLALLLAGLAAGVALQTFWPLLLSGQAPVQPPDLKTAQSIWSESMRAIREFPLVGSGLGSFATIHAYFKDHDLSSNTAMSSLIQWGVETGAAGAAIVAAGRALVLDSIARRTEARRVDRWLPGSRTHWRGLELQPAGRRALDDRVIGRGHLGQCSGWHLEPLAGRRHGSFRGTWVNPPA